MISSLRKYKVKVIRTFYVRSALAFQALPRSIYTISISISISISYGQNTLYLWTGWEGHETAC